MSPFWGSRKAEPARLSERRAVAFRALRWEPVAELVTEGARRSTLALASLTDGSSRLAVVEEAPRFGAAERLSAAFQQRLVASGTDHANVLGVFGLERVGGTEVLLREWVDGPTLSEVQAECGSALPLALTLEILTDALDGLEVLHSRSRSAGMRYYRCLSPRAIHLSLDGEVKLEEVPFQPVNADRRDGPLKSRLRYVAPEAVASLTAAAGEPQHRPEPADVFAFGVMLWEAATGRRLWAGMNDHAMLEMLQAGDIPVPADPVSDCPRSLLRWIRRATQRNPESRPSLSTLLEGLRETRAELPREDLAAFMVRHFDSTGADVNAGALLRGGLSTVSATTRPAAVEIAGPRTSSWWLAAGAAAVAVATLGALSPGWAGTLAAKTPAPPTEMLVDVWPPSAQVTVDGVRVEQIPVAVAVRPGASVELRAEAPGFAPRVLKAQMAPGARLQLRLAPLRQP